MRLVVLIVIFNVFLESLYALPLSEPVIPLLIQEKGGPDRVQKTLEALHSSQNDVVIITQQQEFKMLSLVSKLQKRPFVVCFLSSAHGNEEHMIQVRTLQNSFQKLSNEQGLNALLYAIVDVDQSSDNKELLATIRSLSGLTADQSALPLIVMFSGDTMLLPISSGYLSYEHLRTFILSKFKLTNKAR